MRQRWWCCGDVCVRSLTITNGPIGGSIPDALGNLWSLQCVVVALCVAQHALQCCLSVFPEFATGVWQIVEVGVADADGHSPSLDGKHHYATVRDYMSAIIHCSVCVSI
jgi:hypothetical protein